MKPKPPLPRRTLPLSRVALATSVAVAALCVELASGTEAPTEFRLFPAGEFSAVDGRPVECPAWVMLDEDGERLVAEAAARQSDYLIDYDHQTLRAEKNGQPAIASGWFRAMEWRPGDGLYLTGVNWTALAAQRIADKEFRYVSPVFSYDKKTGRVLRIAHAALTNNPGIDGLTDLAALAAELFPADQSADQSILKEKQMDELLEQLRWLLNLPVGTTAEEVTAQLQKLIDQIKGTGNAAASFDLAAYLQQQGSQLAALTAQVAMPDPAKFVPFAAYQESQTALAALSAQINAEKVDGLVAGALASGKLTPAMEDWARDLGKNNFAALSAFIDKAVAVAVPGALQSGGLAPSGGKQQLSEAQLAVCSATGVSPEAFLATLQAETGA